MAVWPWYFGLTWLGCLWVFPGWWLGSSGRDHGLVALGLAAYLAINLTILYRVCSRLPGAEGGRAEEPRPVPPLRDSPVLVAAFLLSLLLHAYPLTLPVSSIGDEHVHAHSPLFILRRLPPLPGPILPVACGLVVLGGVVLARRGLPALSRAHPGLRLGAVLVVAAGCLAAAWLLESRVLAGLEDQRRHLFRYPPLGKILGVLWYGMAGGREWSFRFLSLLFHVGAAYYIYRMARLVRGATEAAAASTLFLLMPLAHYYGHAHYLDMGGVFFLTAASYHFLRARERPGSRHVFASAFLVGVGFLYKDTVLPVLGAFWFVWLLDAVRARRWPRRDSITLTWLALVPIGPWMLVQRFAGERVFSPRPGNLLSADCVSAQLRALVPSATLLVTLLLAGGIVVTLRGSRDALGWLCLATIAIYYTLVTLDGWYYLARFFLSAYPAVAILAAVPFRFLPGRRSGPVAVLLVGAVLGWRLAVAPSRPLRFAFHDVRNYDPTAQSAYLPYRELVGEIDSLVEPGSTIFDPVPTSSRDYYLELSGKKHRYTWLDGARQPEEEQSLEKLIGFCRSRGVDYVVIPGEGSIDPRFAYPAPHLIRAVLTSTDFRQVRSWSFDAYGLTLLRFEPPQASRRW